jgi:hypothetical protein
MVKPLAPCVRKPSRQPARVIDLDAADFAVGVGIKLDVVGGAGTAAFRHLNETGGAANAERRGRRRDFHVAGLGHGCRHEGDRALGDVENPRVVLAAVLVDVGVDGDLRVGLEIKGGGIDEGDAERRIRSRLHHIVEVDVVLDLERRGGVVADHAGGAGHGGDVADRLFRRLLHVGGGRSGCRRGRLRRCGLCLRQFDLVGRGNRTIRHMCWHTADQQQKR